LPCVLLREAAAEVDSRTTLLGRREAADYDAVYPSLVQELAVGGNRVEAGLLTKLEPCRYAIPWEILTALPDELDFSAVAFTATMDDGAAFAFATAFAMGFFEMPEGYSGSRVRTVTPGASVTSYTHREKPCFVAFVEGVDFGAA
jgi:hypothetical protein